MSKSIISFEASDELKEMLRVEAFERHLTISATIRFLLKEYFNGKKDNKK